MTSINLDQSYVDPQDPKFQPMLKNLQGNILKAHGRKYNWYIFLKFKENMQPHVRRWMQQLKKEYITTAWIQAEHSKEKVKNASFDGGLFLTMGLSSGGYYYLKLPVYPNDTSFIGGMNKRAKCLGDDVAKFDPAFRQEGNLDAVLLVADDSYDNLVAYKSTLESQINGENDPMNPQKQAFAEIVVVEEGATPKNKDGYLVDHFGYADGVSNPIFMKNDIDAYKKDEGIDKYDPISNLNTVLVPDNTTNKDNCFGSYLVFRKLKMDTKVFDEDIKAIAKKIEEYNKDHETFKINAHMLENTAKAQPEQEGCKQSRQTSSYAEELAAAYVMGRFKDGTPVIDHEVPDSEAGGENNFDFTSDLKSVKCPYFSHIRKTNPRSDLKGDNIYWPKPKITRRGSNYGKKESADKGLLFSCYQSSIQNQFEHIQVAWANNYTFSNGAAGIDPVAGQKIDVADPECQKMAPSLGLYLNCIIEYGKYFFPKKYGVGGNRALNESPEYYFEMDLKKNVEAKGGGYFFFPSMGTFEEVNVYTGKEDTMWSSKVRFQQIIVTAWTDPQFDEKIRSSDPDISTGAIIKLLDVYPLPDESYYMLVGDKVSFEFSKKYNKRLMYFVLPPKPEGLSDEEIKNLTLTQFQNYYPKLEESISKMVTFDPLNILAW